MIHALRAFRHPNFRLFFGGQSVSLVGTWVQQIAMNWLIYRLTGSAWLLGLVGFASQAPVLLLSPLAGAWCDRLDRRKLLLTTQTLFLLHAFLLAYLAYSGLAVPWLLLLLAGALGMIVAFDTPVRQSLLSDLVDKKEDLPSAIAMNSAIMNGGRLVGPSIAGIMLAMLSEALCFFVNGFSKLAVIGAALAMRIPARPAAVAKQSVLGELRQGLSYARSFPPVRILLPVVAVMSFMAMPYQSLMPIFAAEMFLGGPRTLGFLIGAAGLGALGGTVFLAARRGIGGLPRVILAAVSVVGGAQILFAYCQVLWISLLLMMALGCGIICTGSSINIILQTVVDDDKRGRVMSLYITAFLGSAPLGSLAEGALAHRIGVQPTMLIAGICCLAAAFWLGRRLPDLRAGIGAVHSSKP